MSSSSEENESGAEEETLNGDTVAEQDNEVREGNLENGTPARSGRIVDLFQEELEEVTTPPPLGNGTNIFKTSKQLGNASDDGSVDVVPPRTGSPVDSLLSVPDDTPSVQVCLRRLPFRHF